MIRGEQIEGRVKPKKKIFHIGKRRAGQLKTERDAIYLAYKDPRVPWYAKLLIACVIGYVFSPIDLIPDFIPILGYVDDLILVPIGITFVIRIDSSSCFGGLSRKGSYGHGLEETPNWVAVSVIIVIWLLFASSGILLTARVIRDWDMVLN
ncbi:MAG: YkvA family protein [Thermodesulfobacteriota bacterium]